MATQQTVVENEVGKELVVFYQKTFLSRNKREALTHFEKEIRKVGNDCRLHIFLVITTFSVQSKKFEHHWVFDYFGRAFGNAFLTSHGKYTLLVVAHQQTFVKHRIYLPFRLAGCPCVIYGFQFVVLTFVGVWNLNQHTILAPVQLGTQCVPIWICPIKLTAKLKLTIAKSASELRFQAFLLNSAKDTLHSRRVPCLAALPRICVAPCANTSAHDRNRHYARHCCVKSR